MVLLEARHNINPVSVFSKQIAIVDDRAIESEGDSGEAFAGVGGSESNQISVYIVRQGDTLSGIAKMFGVTTNTIVWANDIKGGVIKEGNELVILPISGVKHSVKSGDTLASIAKKYKADLDDLVSYNGFAANDKLVVGSEIIVPDGTLSAPTSSGVAVVSSGKSTFGFFLKPINGGKKTQGIHGNNGVDLGARTGTPVLASASGKVIVARNGGWNGGYGSYVVISHSNGTQTLYAHLSAVYVSVGQQVSQGKTIGAVGNTGKSTGPHLHFEIRGAKNPF
ncbi:MAG: peptidoglycan DD-metalloendopeptidase family protein [Parcubacteria group bacterium]